MDDKVIEMEGSRASQRGLVEVPQQSYAVATQGPSPAEMIQYVMQKGGTIEQLREFVALQKEMEADQARKAFAEDMARFKAIPLTIKKDKHVRFGTTEYDHATIGNVCKVIVAALAEFGFSHRWTSDQRDGKLVVTCVITHKLGHSQSNTLEAAPDSSGGKNGIQSIGSTNTYLQRYTLLAATGVATEDQPDDDGQTSEPIIKPTKERPAIAGKAFDNAIKAVRGGTYDPADMRQYYKLTPDQQTVLADAEKGKK